MQTVFTLAVALTWPLCAHAEYFHGIDDLKRQLANRCPAITYER
jgi:hypothetical protein